jgi:tRNA dimethylallyltransferase
MVDVLEPWENCSAARYVQEADPILQDILARGKTAIVVGGTGLYVDALIQGRSFAPYPSTGKRQALEQEADEKGMEEMLRQLQAVDPDSAARLHIRDRKRILRALEVYQETGKTMTQHNLETQQVPDKYDPLWLGLTYEPRQVLYDRIDLRVDLMLRQGLLPEIEALLRRGIPKTATALQAIGYKEFLPVLEGVTPLETAVETVKQESRRYAKRQLTWFRRNPKIHWLVQQPGQTLDETLSLALAHAASFDVQM